MLRRRFLLAVGAGASLAGCASSDSRHQPTSSRTPTPEETASPSPEATTTDVASETPTETGGESAEPLWSHSEVGKVKALQFHGETETLYALGERALALTPPGTERWTVPLNDDADSRLWIRDALYFLDGDTFRSLAFDGTDRWTFSDGSTLYLLAVADAIALVASASTTSGKMALVAVEVATGDERWRAELPRTLDAFVHDGTVYAAHHNGVTALATADGTRQWLDAAQNTAVVDLHEGTGTLVVTDDAIDADEEDYAYGLAADDGTVRWQFDGRNHHATILDGDAVDTGAEVGTLAALDVADGAERWRAGRFKGAGNVRAVSDGVVYATTPQPVALDATTGDERWRNRTVAAVRELLTRGDRVFARTFAGTLHAIGPDGEERWQFGADSRLTALEASPKRVYVGSRSGSVYAFDA